jgi:cytochrome c oxidase subunit 3
MRKSIRIKTMVTQPHPHKYYVPEPSVWPFVLTVALFLCAGSGAVWLNGYTNAGPWALLASLVLAFVATFVWFRDLIRENLAGAFTRQEDISLRWSMFWFILSEVMFFLAFFGALYYTRLLAVPWLSGAGYKAATGAYLWPHFPATWPTNGPGNVGGTFQPVAAWGLPAISTVVMLSSSVTLTWAHWGLKENQRLRLGLGVAATLILGLGFLVLQGVEYMDAYQHLGLTLGTGIYGATFFLLTGLDGVHVLMGTVMLAVILGRSLKGHFSPRDHFGFEAVAWYWHFVDVLWLALFVSVYIL